MPQASTELRDRMEKWFGSFWMDEGPISFLKSHGFELSKEWCWKLPTPSHTVSCYEHGCIQFLIEEWDFGGVVDDNHSFICLCGDLPNFKREAFARAT